MTRYAVSMSMVNAEGLLYLEADSPEVLPTETYAITIVRDGVEFHHSSGRNTSSGLYATLTGARKANPHRTTYVGQDEDGRPQYRRLPIRRYRGRITWELVEEITD